jgi:hypothetical protein
VISEESFMSVLTFLGLSRGTEEVLQPGGIALSALDSEVASDTM